MTDNEKLLQNLRNIKSKIKEIEHLRDRETIEHSLKMDMWQKEKDYLETVMWDLEEITRS